MSALLLTALLTDLIAFINPANIYFLGNWPSVKEETFEVNWLAEEHYGINVYMLVKTHYQSICLSARLEPKHPCSFLQMNYIYFFKYNSPKTRWLVFWRCIKWDESMNEAENNQRKWKNGKYCLTAENREGKNLTDSRTRMPEADCL